MKAIMASVIQLDRRPGVERVAQSVADEAYAGLADAYVTHSTHWSL